MNSRHRYLVAHLPCFRLERCGWSAQQPAALLAMEKNAMRVQCATPPALKKGVRPGMTAAEARALLPELQLEPLDAEAEAADLQDLVGQLLRVSPNVATLPPDSLVVEVSRVGRRHGAGAERVLLERVRLRLQALGHLVTVVIADDPGTAWAAAVWGRRCRIVPPGQAARVLAELPLAALELPERELALLEGLGLHTVGAFAALPPASVVGRLSPLAVAAHALARGQGPKPTLPCWRADEPLVLHQALMAPVVEQQALIFVLNALLRDAAARLAPADLAVSRLVLRLSIDPQDDPSDEQPIPAGAGGEQEVHLRLGAPTRDPRHMLQLLQARMQDLRLAGPVLALTLELPEPVCFTGRQRDLLDRDRAAEELGDVLARLQDELGAEAVMFPRREARHRPEAAWSPAPAPAGPQALLLAPALPHADLLGQQRPDGSDPVREWEGFPDPPPPWRPAILLHPPLAVELREQGGGLQLHSNGRWLPLVDVDGPEEICAEWWRGGVDRRYLCATLADGRRAWLYQEDEQWALHGWFD